MSRRINRPNNTIQSSDKSLSTNLSKEGFNKLSDYKRATIQSVESDRAVAEENSRPTATVAHSSTYKSLLKKRATVGPATIPTAKGLTDIMGPEVYSPLFQLANLNLPRDRVTLNAWNRIFYDTHPIVRNAINLHSSYPISKINISHPVKEIQEYFLEMAERLDLYSVVYGAALEFWKMGEVFPYAELDRDTNSWKRITILNPDFIHLNKSPISDDVSISIKPDAGLQKLINSNSPSDIALKRRLPKHIIDAVKRGQTIPLDNFNISHLKLLSSPYDTRGTSIIVSVYKDLMYYDKIRECKLAQADGMINPLSLIKVGSESYKATQSDLEAIRIALEDAQYDKDFKLITHDAVAIERIGYSGAILDVAADVELILNNLYTGLMVPKALMDQEGVTYASSSVGLEVLRQRYDIFRNMIKKWLEQKIFGPICELQNFFEYRQSEKVLLVPTIDFNHMNLYDMNDYVSNISTFVASKQVSVQTLYRTLGLSYDEEKRRLKEEAIDFAIRTKEEAALASMRLRELENLDIDSMIPEAVDEQGLPGQDMPELPGMDMGGGMPPMGGPGGEEMGAPPTPEAAPPAPGQPPPPPA